MLERLVVEMFHIFNLFSYAIDGHKLFQGQFGSNIKFLKSLLSVVHSIPSNFSLKRLADP